MKRTIIIKLTRDPEKGCRGCKFFYSNSEYPETYCHLAERGWGMGYYDGGPAPEWCPFREGVIDETT